MRIAIESSTSSSVICTSIGVLPVGSLNNWNNTAFSQLCLSKSDDALSMLIRSSALSEDKKQIAANKLAERYGDCV